MSNEYNGTLLTSPCAKGNQLRICYSTFSPGSYSQYCDGNYDLYMALAIIGCATTSMFLLLLGTEKFIRYNKKEEPEAPRIIIQQCCNRNY